MLCSAYFGKINDDSQDNWYESLKDPYTFLEVSVKLDGKGHELLQKGDTYFSDRVQLDWGSFAWRCDEEAILAFLDATRSNLAWKQKQENDLQDRVWKCIIDCKDAAFAVVFVEEV